MNHLKNESTPKLTESQRKLIEQNLITIKAIIGKIIRNNKNYRWYLGDNYTIINECISHVPEVVMDFNKDLCKSQTFSEFVAQRCILKRIDEYRSQNKHIRKQNNRIKEREKIIDNLKAEKGFAADNEVNDQLVKEGFFGNKNFQQLRPEIRSIEKCRLLKDDTVSTMNYEWEDFKNGIINKSNDYFKELPGDGNEHRNMSCRAYKVLIKDYLIPNSENTMVKTLGQISKELNLTEGRLSQIINGEKMKDFFAIVYDKKKDLNVE